MIGFKTCLRDHGPQYQGFLVRLASGGPPGPDRDHVRGTFGRRHSDAYGPGRVREQLMQEQNAGSRTVERSGHYAHGIDVMVDPAAAPISLIEFRENQKNPEKDRRGQPGW